MNFAYANDEFIRTVLNLIINGLPSKLINRFN